MWRWRRKWIKLEQKLQKAKEEEAPRNVVRKQKYVLYPIPVYDNKNYEKETYFDVCRILFKHEAQSKQCITHYQLAF